MGSVITKVTEVMKYAIEGKNINPLKVDMVNHPPHYKSNALCSNCDTPIECIQVTRHMTFNLGNAIKYIWRSGKKSGDAIQDLEKAIWYLKDEVQKLRGNS